MLFVSEWFHVHCFCFTVGNILFSPFLSRKLLLAFLKNNNVVDNGLAPACPAFRRWSAAVNVTGDSPTGVVVAKQLRDVGRHG